MTPRKNYKDYLGDNGKLYSEEAIAVIKQAIRSMYPDDENHYVPRTAIHDGDKSLGRFSVTRIEGQYYAIFFGEKHNSHLGAGMFGKTKLAQNLDTGEWVAIKIMREAASHEAEITKQAGLGRSLQYTRKSHKDESMAKHEFVMSLAPGQSMLHLAYDDTIPFNERMRAAKALVNEYANIHLKGILHLDIKLENTFYDVKTGKLTPLDFGLSELMDANRQVITNYCGTPTHLPTEIKYGRINTFSEKTEVFSIGVTMAEALGFNLEFANNTEGKKSVEYFPVKPPNAFDQQQHELAKLINLMINANPLMRPSLAAIAEELNRIETHPLPAYMNELLKAIESNDSAKMLRALNDASTEPQFNINNPVDIRGNLLHIAAMKGKDKAVAMLLEHGADINAKGLNGHTALHLATCKVKDNYRDTANVLLADANIKVGLQNNDGETALHIAARNGNIMVAKEILEDVPDLASKNNLQQTAYDLAVKSNIPAHDSLPELLEPVDIFAQLAKTPGFGSNKNNKPSADTNRNSSSTEIMQQRLSEIETLTTALHVAIRTGDEITARKLCRAGADVNLLINGEAALHVAARCKEHYNIEFMDFLIPRANLNLPDQFGSTLLHIAAEFNDAALIDTLVADKRIQVNCQDINGDTPLHIAFLCGNEAAANALTSHPETVTDIKNNDSMDAQEIYLQMEEMKEEKLKQREVVKPHTIEHEAPISTADAALSLDSDNRISLKAGGN